MRPKTTVRDKIVSAALDRFHALGYTATGVQEIVDLAGVPKGSFYNYFKAKELLALEVLKLYLDETNRDDLSNRNKTPLVRLRDHFELMALQYKSHGYSKGCLVGNFVVEATDDTPLLRDFLQISLESWTSLIRDVIAEGQADGSILGNFAAQQMARFLINSWEGAIMRMKLTDSGEPLQDFFQIALPLLTG